MLPVLAYSPLQNCPPGELNLAGVQVRPQRFPHTGVLERVEQGRFSLGKWGCPERDRVRFGIGRQSAH
jgi:hypothetical protein